MSVHQDSISWREHSVWFSKKLCATDSLIFVASHLGELVGSLRWDKAGSTKELSWMLGAAQRGQGLGSLMLETFVKEHSADYVAFVKSENTASSRMCEKAGFTLAADGEGLLQFRNF